MSLYLGGIGHFKIYWKSSGPSDLLARGGGSFFLNPVLTLVGISNMDVLDKNHPKISNNQTNQIFNVCFKKEYPIPHHPCQMPCLPCQMLHPFSFNDKNWVSTLGASIVPIAPAPARPSATTASWHVIRHVPLIPTSERKGTSIIEVSSPTVMLFAYNITLYVICSIYRLHRLYIYWLYIRYISRYIS